MCQLVDDLLFGVDKFIADLRNDKTLEEKCSSRIESVNQPDDVANRNKVKGQMEEAWKYKGGLLDQNGNVLKFHSDTST